MHPCGGEIETDRETEAEGQRQRETEAERQGEVCLCCCVVWVLFRRILTDLPHRVHRVLLAV